MTVQRSCLVWIYLAVAVIALVGTWGNNLQYMSPELNPIQVNILFWQETFANPASRSITVDIFWLALPVTLWMMMEARRLQMRGIWWYLILSWLVAVSVTVPVFLAMRERKLMAQGDNTAGTLSKPEVAWALAVTAGILFYTVKTLAG